MRQGIEQPPVRPSPPGPRPAVDRSAFEGAPPWSYVTEEGWLVIGMEAWTLDEWRGEWGMTWRMAWRRAHPPRRKRPRPAPQRYASDAERVAAQRRSTREWNRRRRADPDYRAHEARRARERKQSRGES